ncbi:MAG: hypothetical protein Q8Q05_00140 [bacterium]|nr:hypothetical protein [bacterium]
MRSKVLVVLVVVVAILAAYMLFKPNSTQTRQGTIELTHLPDQYCPLSAAVVTTDLNTKTPKILLDTTVAIDECRYITLAKLSGLGSGSQFIFVKISGQLAFRVQIDSIKGRYQYAPSLGDVNNDNIIDSADETLVGSALFTSDEAQISTNDLDQDKKVSVLDLSLTRTNHRAGVERPDGQSWSQS